MAETEASWRIEKKEHLQRQWEQTERQLQLQREEVDARIREADARSFETRLKAADMILARDPSLSWEDALDKAAELESRRAPATQ